MSTNYSPTIVTDGAVFVVDALMPSTATSATTLYDRAGSYDGTMYNGTCLNFDGSDDWVDCGSSPITSNSAFSWAAWINPTGASGTPFFLGTNVAGGNGGLIG
jgi:hypothetical protein